MFEVVEAALELKDWCRAAGYALIVGKHHPLRWEHVDVSIGFHGCFGVGGRNVSMASWAMPNDAKGQDHPSCSQVEDRGKGVIVVDTGLLLVTTGDKAVFKAFNAAICVELGFKHPLGV